MKRAHFIPNYLINPLHPVTINLIGIGGSGSQVLTSLARMHVALIALGHKGLHVRAFDADTVTEANLGRQLFSESEIGINKAVALVTRVNNFFGLNWEACPFRFNTAMTVKYKNANITISCVDKAKDRFTIGKIIIVKGEKVHNGTVYNSPKRAHYEHPYYWMDFGNTQTIGQVILGTCSLIIQPTSKQYEAVEKLPVVTDMFPDMKDDPDQGPSCSLAEALEKQDLFINSALVQTGMSLLWKVFREGMITHRGLYMNLDKINVNPIAV